MKISLLTLTIDRFALTKEVMDKNLALLPPDFDYELLVADNGSKDRQVIDYIASIPILKYHRLNSKNEGCGKALNQLYLRATGDVICLFSNDILMPPLWVKEMVRVLNVSREVGQVGVQWGHINYPELSVKFGIEAHWLTQNVNRVFGTMMFRRDLVEKIGLFPEHYHQYGLEDSSLSERVNRSGYASCYLDKNMFFSHHMANDAGDGSEYRRMKDESLAANALIYDRDVRKWDGGGALYEPLPPLRESI